MNMQPAPQSKSSSDGSPHRRDEREGVFNNTQSIKSNPAITTNKAFNGEAERLKRHSRDSLVYLTACKIGHLVEVHLKNGSVYSGIFHAADVEKDFGIILKMASLVKEGTLGGYKSRSQFGRKPPSETLVIPADELVQVVAKDLSISSDGILNTVQNEKPVELLTDSSISKSFHVDQGRELTPWVPDGDVPQGLDNVFDEPWERGWDQFKVNESLFGVKSTFDEEVYTTTLTRSTRTRELAAQALRIAREIEGENTRDLHVAEERGIQPNEEFDIDEETRYSAVRPVDRFDDSGFDEEDDKLLDTLNDQTFGGSSTSNVQKPASYSDQKPTSSSGKGYEDVRGDNQPSRNNTNVDQSCSISDDDARHLPSEQRSKNCPAPGSSISESQLGERRKNDNPEVSHSNKSAEEGENLGGVGTSELKTVAERETQVVSQASGKTKSESSFGQSASTPSRPGISPSTLNPKAKEFKLNPNAQSFIPLQPPAHAVRPQSPIADASFYYPAAPVLQMPGPVVDGIQPQYLGHQQMLYYPGEQHGQTYYPPSARYQYPEQGERMIGRPPYKPENPYNE